MSGPTVPFSATQAVHSVDPIWERVSEQASNIARFEPAMSSFLHATLINHGSLEEAIIHRIANRLDHLDMCANLIRQGFREALEFDPDIANQIRADLIAVYDRDPACHRVIEPILYFKGFQALSTHRFAHALYQAGRKDFAYYLQSRSSAVFQTDIHPAVKLGRGVMLDHATGLVVGETAVIEDNVSILHAVTLGGTGKATMDRHPKIRSGVLLGAGAKILGNIEIGACSRVASGSVVLKEVPPMTTVAGVPAKVVGRAGCAEPSRSMDQILNDMANDETPL